MMNMNPQDAVPQLLLMDYDVDEMTLKEITETYTEALRKSSKKIFQRYDMAPKSESQTSSITPARNSKDVSIDEIYQAAFDAWTSVAWKLGFSLPDEEQIQFAMTVGPRDAVIAGFQWTDSEKEAEEIAQQYFDKIKKTRDAWIKQGYATTVNIDSDKTEIAPIPPVLVMPGVVGWIQSLRKVEMGCGVVSYLEEDQMKILLEYAGLSDLLPNDVRVSHSNGYQRDSQQLLGAALRIERRPDHCVAFDTSSYGSVAAHDVDMRSVSLVGPYPRYELLAADTTAVSVEELTAMNIRRLFGERIYDQPMLDMQSRQPETTKRVKTKYEWDDD
jgi:beta-phosphoglucomutase-like phosphatase (HAD superfamily)